MGQYTGKLIKPREDGPGQEPSTSVRTVHLRDKSLDIDPFSEMGHGLILTCVGGEFHVQILKEGEEVFLLLTDEVEGTTHGNTVRWSEFLNILENNRP